MVNTQLAQQFINYPYRKRVLIYALALHKEQYELLAELIKVVPAAEAPLFLKDVEQYGLKKFNSKG